MTTSLMSVEQIAEAMHLSPWTVRDKMRRNQFPGAFRKGKRWLLSRRQFEKLIAAWEAEATTSVAK